MATDRSALLKFCGGVFGVLAVLGLVLALADLGALDEPWRGELSTGRWGLLGLGAAGLAATLGFNLGVPGARPVLAGLLVLAVLCWVGYCGSFIWVIAGAPESDFHRHGKWTTLFAGGGIALLFLVAGAAAGAFYTREVLRSTRS